MSSQPAEQLQAIHSMLAAGHRSVHLERHTLLLIGAVGGFLTLATEWVITDARFPEAHQRGVALLVWLAFWLTGMAWLEHRLTRQARARRAETLPFAQAQVTRAWWMLLAVGCLGSFAMFFHGGGGMIYALWTVLLGLGIYIYGLFSRPFIESLGLATLLLGVLGLASGLPYIATQWLNAACFAIGMPLAGWLNARVAPGRWHPLPALALWLAAVTLPPILAVHGLAVPAPIVTPVTDARAIGPGEQVLRLAAGTHLPLRVDLRSDLLSVPPDASLTLVLDQAIEVALLDGTPDGRYRVGDSPWHAIREGALGLRIYRFSPGLSQGQPEIGVQADVDIRALRR